MSASTIRKALGTLQDDSDHAQAWTELEAAIGFVDATKPLDPPAGSPATDPSGDPAMTRQGSSLSSRPRRTPTPSVWSTTRWRGCWRSSPRWPTARPKRLALQTELARVLDEQVMDANRAALAYGRILELSPDEPAAMNTLERNTAKKGKWSELAARYIDEAQSTEDPAFKASRS